MTDPVAHTVDLDSETTDLESTGRMWELALVVENHPRHREWDGEWHFYFPAASLEHASEASLAIGGYYPRMEPIKTLMRETLSRHDDEVVYVAAGPEEVEAPSPWITDARAAELIANLCAGALIYGVNPDHDKPFIKNYLREHGQVLTAHYHWNDLAGITHHILGRPSTQRPGKSDRLAEALGVQKPTSAERHTALGDARWANRWRKRLDEIAAVSGEQPRRVS